MQDDEILLAQLTGSEADADANPEPGDTDESSLPAIPERLETVGIEINPDRLLDVDDNSVGIAPEEAEAFYYLLDHASRVPLDELHAAGQDDLSRETLSGGARAVSRLAR